MWCHNSSAGRSLPEDCNDHICWVQRLWETVNNPVNKRVRPAYCRMSRNRWKRDGETLWKNIAPYFGVPWGKMQYLLHSCVVANYSSWKVEDHINAYIPRPRLIDINKHAHTHTRSGIVKRHQYFRSAQSVQIASRTDLTVHVTRRCHTPDIQPNTKNI